MQLLLALFAKRLQQHVQQLSQGGPERGHALLPLIGERGGVFRAWKALFEGENARAFPCGAACRKKVKKGTVAEQERHCFQSKKGSALERKKPAFPRSAPDRRRRAAAQT